MRHSLWESFDSAESTFFRPASKEGKGAPTQKRGWLDTNNIKNGNLCESALISPLRRGRLTPHIWCSADCNNRKSPWHYSDLHLTSETESKPQLFGATVECSDVSETETLKVKFPFARQSLTSTKNGHINRRMADDRVCLLVAENITLIESRR